MFLRPTSRLLSSAARFHRISLEETQGKILERLPKCLQNDQEAIDHVVNHQQPWSSNESQSNWGHSDNDSCGSNEEMQDTTKRCQPGAPNPIKDLPEGLTGFLQLLIVKEGFPFGKPLQQRKRSSSAVEGSKCRQRSSQRPKMDLKSNKKHHKKPKKDENRSIGGCRKEKKDPCGIYPKKKKDPCRQKGKKHDEKYKDPCPHKKCFGLVHPQALLLLKNNAKSANCKEDTKFSSFSNCNHFLPLRKEILAYKEA